MGKNPLQQQKLLRLQEFLLEETDEEHGVTMEEIIDHLASYGIKAERKSIYENIETLNQCGMDILKEKQGLYTYYYVASRDFETAELRLLADAVASSRFITARKSSSLLKKLAGLVSRHQGGGLQRQVYVASRIKNMNETIFYLIDELNRALSENVAIEFQYNDWALEEGKLIKKPRHAGKRYQVSPWQLLWQDEFYYLIAFDHEFRQIRHYRVDRMDRLSLTQEKRQGADAFREIHMENYTSRLFGMFAGKTERATIEFPAPFLDVMIDRFGKDLQLTRQGDLLQCTAEVIPSRHFFGWLFSLGPEVTIISPAHLKEEYRNQLNQQLEKENKNG